MRQHLILIITLAATTFLTACSTPRPDLRMLLESCKKLAKEHQSTKETDRYVSGYMNRPDSVKLVFEQAKGQQMSLNCLINEEGRLDKERSLSAWQKASKSKENSQR